MSDPDRFDGLLAVLDDLMHANETATILVEGRRDVESLHALGCRGTIVPLNRGMPLFEVCEEVAGQGAPVILLTDWDRRGDVLLEQVRTGLQANGCPVDTIYRDRIRASVKGYLKDVESLSSLVERGLERFHRKTLAEHVAARHLGWNAASFG